MNIFSMMKMSNRWSQFMNKLLMISLWGSVMLFFIIALTILMGEWNLESVRLASIIGGIGVLLLVFTFLMKRSFSQHQSPKTLHDYYEVALELEETKGIHACQEIYETMCKEFDSNLGPAYLSLAHIHLQKNNEEQAIEYIHQAAKENWIWYPSGLEILANFYEKHQLDEKLDRLKKEINRIKELEEKASKEIYYFSDSDLFRPNDQPLYVFASVIQVLLQYLRLRRLFIVEKILTTIPNRKVYVFALVVDEKKEAKKHEEKIYHHCYDILAKPLGKYIFFEYTVSFIFLSEQDSRDQKLIRKMEEIEGAEVGQIELDALFNN